MEHRYPSVSDPYRRQPPHPPAVHQSTAIIVLTMIRLLAYTLSLLFYQRQVRSHARGDLGTFLECAKRLAYWFAVLPTNTT
jgi:hypothetical protein